MNSQSTDANRGTAKLRLGRQSLSNQIYHVTTSTHDRAPLLETLQCGRTVVTALAREQTVNGINTLAYVVMPDHLHWLLQLPKHANLSRSVNNVKSLSARDINKTMGTSGPVWQRGFFDRGIRSEEDVVGVARYIVANPIRAGIIGELGQYSLWDAIWVSPDFRL